MPPVALPSLTFQILLLYRAQLPCVLLAKAPTSNSLQPEWSSQAHCQLAYTEAYLPHSMWHMNTQDRASFPPPLQVPGTLRNTHTHTHTHKHPFQFRFICQPRILSGLICQKFYDGARAMAPSVCVCVCVCVCVHVWRPFFYHFLYLVWIWSLLILHATQTLGSEFRSPISTKVAYNCNPSNDGEHRNILKASGTVSLPY